MRATPSNKNVAAILCALTLLWTIPFSATANGRWTQNHPRRAEVNWRLANQNRRIAQERREGEINRGQAAQFRRQDRQIRQEERFMARQNGGHITRLEQRALNQQENQVSREIER
jgi:hypothetical protein